MRFHGVFLGNQHAIWSKPHNGKVRKIIDIATSQYRDIVKKIIA